ncbi:MAG: dihydrodipicolinate synthase family protein [SAR202 cluster bacterium]|nr:dihydrodipicolinate synthase family protein [SAR202 cluster bacterium]|tara:strand:+ start:21342 stop:22241 length:900 start_codon:yes stop_codon:yes gene_type:complete
MSTSKIKGIIVPIVTPLSESGELDSKSLKKLIDYFIKSGVHGIWASGTTGEFANLTLEQRFQSIEKTIKYANNKIPIIANIACAGTQDSIDFGKKVADLNPTGIACTPPFYYLNTQSEIIDHYQNISDELKSQLWVYNIPSTVKNVILPSTTLQLGMEKTVIGIKDSSGSLENIANLSISVNTNNVDMNIFIGSTFLTALTEGILVDGVIPGLGNLIPKTFVKAWENGLLQKKSEMQLLQNEMTKAVRIMNLGENGISCIKAGLYYLGILNSDQMTKPFKTLSQTEKQKIKSLISALST